jgi:plastocyanin
MGPELFRKRYVTLAAALALLLAVTPVSGAPALKVGSTASYTLAGSLLATQSCIADPSSYYLQGCLGYTPPEKSTASVSIKDNGACTSNNSSCSFDPQFLTVRQGTTVTWTNTGTIVHTVVENYTGPMLMCPAPICSQNIFASGNILPGGTFSHTFNLTGNYKYYDSLHSWMKGEVDVFFFTPPQPPTPPPPTFQTNVGGTVGWSVEGLSSSEVNLLVSHSLSLSVFVFTPITESGTLVQSIDLSTRVESAGTATDLIEHVLTGLSAASSGSSFSGAGNVWSQMLASTSSDPSYTFWWVNGPLSSGTALQVMDGWASVTGSENLDLGSLGTVSAWIVTSQFTQSFNANIPNPSNPLASGSTTSASANLNFLWSYGKESDLLLRSLANTTLTMHSVSNQQVYVSNPCAPTGYCPTFASVKVTRDMRLVLTLSLHLSNTSLRLDQRMPTGGQTQDLPSLVSSLMTTPWSVLGVVGGTAAAIIGLSVWLGQRARRNEISKGSTIPSTGPPSPAPPSS